MFQDICNKLIFELSPMYLNLFIQYEMLYLYSSSASISLLDIIKFDIIKTNSK